MFTGPKWKLALYVDNKASEQQKDALTKIFSGQAGGFFGAAEGKKRRLKIPTLLHIEIEGMSGSNAKENSVLVNPGFTVAPGFDPIIARSTKYIYNDYGLEWDNSGQNGFYSRFKYDS
jgi:hypothetical protein